MAVRGGPWRCAGAPVLDGHGTVATLTVHHRCTDDDEADPAGVAGQVRRLVSVVPLRRAAVTFHTSGARVAHAVAGLRRAGLAIEVVLANAAGARGLAAWAPNLRVQHIHVSPATHVGGAAKLARIIRRTRPVSISFLESGDQPMRPSPLLRVVLGAASVSRVSATRKFESLWATAVLGVGGVYGVIDGGQPCPPSWTWATAALALGWALEWLETTGAPARTLMLTPGSPVTMLLAPTIREVALRVAERDADNLVLRACTFIGAARPRVDVALSFESCGAARTERCIRVLRDRLVAVSGVPPRQLRGPITSLLTSAPRLRTVVLADHLCPDADIADAVAADLRRVRPALRVLRRRDERERSADPRFLFWTADEK